MVFTGHLWKEGKFWIVTVPSLEITTQGKSKKDALKMIADAVECHVDKSGFRAKGTFLKKSTFILSSNDEPELIALFLKRQRQLNHLTVREVAHRLGYASPSAYAQYESGKHMPGLEKISKFILAINPKARVAVGVV